MVLRPYPSSTGHYAYENNMSGYEEINIQQTESENDPFTIERYRLFHRYLPKNTKKVLDVGCNTGRGGVELKKLNPALTISGIDIVKQRLDKLPENIYSNNIHGSCTEIPVSDGSFDAIVSGEFIEHLRPSDLDATLFEMFRVLRIGGRVLLTTPNPTDIKRILRKESILGGAHLSQHYSDSLKLKLKMIGFSKIRVLGCGKVTRYLGCHFPYLGVYGSYLIMGDKY